MTQISGAWKLKAFAGTRNALGTTLGHPVEALPLRLESIVYFFMICKPSVVSFRGRCGTIPALVFQAAIVGEELMSECSISPTFGCQVISGPKSSAK